MGQTRCRAMRFLLAGILPAAALAACGASMSAEHQSQGGGPAVADAASGGSKAGSGSGGSRAGSGSGGVGSDASGASGRGGSYSVADSSDLDGSASQAGASGT